MVRLVKSLLLAIIFSLAAHLAIVAQPPLTITTNDLSYDGLLFMSPDFQSCLVTDLTGNVLYERISFCNDFKRLDNGDWIYFDGVVRQWKQHEAYSDAIKTTYTISGSNTDLHDIVVTDDHIWLMGRRSYVAISGTLGITLSESTLQKQDLAGNVLFDWHSKDHISLDEATLPLRPGGSFPHANAFYEDTDGNLIVSFRNVSSVMKICVTGNGCQVGEIVWRLGGVKSDFIFVNDRGIDKQHSARMTDICHGGTSRCLILFDNGNDFEPSYSRAVEYVLDVDQGIVTKTWEYTADGQIATPSMGNVQRLENGNTVIGWGSARRFDTDVPTVTVVDWDGNVKYEAILPEGVVNYRAYLYSDWQVIYLPLVVE